MIEYIFDAIKCTAGENVEVTAFITDEAGEFITENCGFMLHDKDGNMITKIEGVCSDNLWSFIIPAELTKGLRGRYEYCIYDAKGTLCFRKPFYLV